MSTECQIQNIAIQNLMSNPEYCNSKLNVKSWIIQFKNECQILNTAISQVLNGVTDFVKISTKFITQKIFLTMTITLNSRSNLRSNLNYCSKSWTAGSILSTLHHNFILITHRWFKSGTWRTMIRKVKVSQFFSPIALPQWRRARFAPEENQELKLVVNLKYRNKSWTVGSIG